MAKEKYRRSRSKSSARARRAGKPVVAESALTPSQGQSPSPQAEPSAEPPPTPGNKLARFWRKIWGEPSARPPLFRRIDWWAFALTGAVTLLAYLWTLAPDLTLEDCGELATASYYLGVPHAPGYPIWTLYSWLFTVLIPFSNVAFRVAISSAVAAALANGILGLMVSRLSGTLLESVDWFADLDEARKKAIGMMAGIVSALLIGFNGFMWSQAVIVEVYTLSVLSLMGVLVCLLHWVYYPEQKKHLYLAAFLFGVCFNNHQTLIVAAIGIEVLAAARDRALGRDAFFLNAFVWIAMMLSNLLGITHFFADNRPMLVLFHLVGLGSAAACAWLTLRTGALLTEWRTGLIALALWLVGASFYFLLPVFSSTNPPMNWAYPRTFDGFLHAITRGQYERISPTDVFGDPLRFGRQLWMYFSGAVEEFHIVFLLLALLPFAFLKRMGKRERAWIIGNTAIYACLAFLLLILLNPNPDRQSQELTKVFFTASHVFIAMFSGLGLALLSGLLLHRYRQFREYILTGGAAAVALALFSLASTINEAYGDPLEGGAGPIALWKGFWNTVFHPYFTPPTHAILAAAFVLLLTAAFTAFVLLHREEVHARVFLVMFALIPAYSVVAHWAKNEQRGHLFGFWFGHDMFHPPFELYPDMTKDAILFGGTDPGRFCPTYMIFCESFIKPSQRRDPDFDRRDVYIITQNALADGTYLNYIRAHYNRSAQIDPPFFRDMIMCLSNLALDEKTRERAQKGEQIRRRGLAKMIAGLTNIVAPLDRLLMDFGRKVEERRRREGVYPKKEIYTPSNEDLSLAFQTYVDDAQKRYLHDLRHPDEPKQLKPGEVINIDDSGHVQVAGQTAVMAINGLLTKVIFGRNPDHEFFVEESFPLDWMYPYMTPYGTIMKLNRNPVREITEEMVRKDHEFWSRYSERLCGNWITYDTPVKEICDFAERVYRRGDLRGYKGDPKFVRDNDAQKAFSKLRNSIAGLYAWRANHVTNTVERARMLREADFAFKQAFAFCPYSPETVSRYVNLLALMGRMDDALRVAETAFRFDPENDFLANVVVQLRQFRENLGKAAAARAALSNAQTARSLITNAQAALGLAVACLQSGRTNEAAQILERLIASSNVPPAALLAAANALVQMNRYASAEPALRKLVALMPGTPELWYDLAGAQLAGGKTNEALQSLQTCMALNARRLEENPNAATNDLRSLAAADPRFRAIRALPQFQQLLRSAPAKPPAGRAPAPK